MAREIIEIKNLIGNTLDSRDAAQKLFECASNYERNVSVVFDFDGVDFMSRSFADEFYKQNKKWSAENNPDTEIDNANIQVIEILQAVSKTQQSRTLANERQ